MFQRYCVILHRNSSPYAFQNRFFVLVKVTPLPRVGYFSTTSLHLNLCLLGISTIKIFRYCSKLISSPLFNSNQSLLQRLLSRKHQYQQCSNRTSKMLIFSTQLILRSSTLLFEIYSRRRNVMT